MVTPREAATVMLVRDDPDLQVFMLRRNLNADWVGGAIVYVHVADASWEMVTVRPATVTEAASSAILRRRSASRSGMTFVVGAIGESLVATGSSLVAVSSATAGSSSFAGEIEGDSTVGSASAFTAGAVGSLVDF